MCVVCTGDGWHLRRLDWCEEVGEALMDEVSNQNYRTGCLDADWLIQGVIHDNPPGKCLLTA